jgi:hypothetical protein
MSIKNTNSDGDNIPKLLRKLRSVKASDNFEMRLKRRILSASDREKYKFVFVPFRIFSQYRLPAYAVSGLAIFAVSVISYYAFFQEGIEPTETFSTLQNQVKVEQESPTEFSAEEKKELAINEALEDNRIERRDKMVNEEKPYLPTAPTDAVKDDIGQTQFPSETEFEINTKSRTRALEIPRANQESNRTGQKTGQKNPLGEQLSVQLKQKADMPKPLLETLEMTYIDSISRVDTSNIHSLKKNRP